MSEEELQKERDKIVAEERAKIQAEIDARDEELKKLRDKDQNFGKVREQLEAAEAAKAAAEKVLLERDQKERDNARDAAIANRVGNDEELKKTVLEQFSRLGKDAKTPEEIEKAIDDSYTLATGKRYDPDAARRAMRGGNGGGNAPIRGSRPGANEPSPELKEALGVFASKGNLKIGEDEIGTLSARAAEKRRNAPSGE